MDQNAFMASLSADAPPEADSALQALWLDRNGDWEAAHDRVQGNATAEAVFNPLGLPQPTFIPAFTERGFAVVPTPPALHAHMASFLRDNLGSAAQEPPNWKRKAEYNIIPRRNAEDPDSNLTSRMVELSEDDKTWILREFQPLVVRSSCLLTLTVQAR